MAIDWQRADLSSTQSVGTPQLPTSGAHRQTPTKQVESNTDLLMQRVLLRNNPGVAYRVEVSPQGKKALLRATTGGPEVKKGFTDLCLQCYKNLKGVLQLNTEARQKIRKSPEAPQQSAPNSVRNPPGVGNSISSQTTSTPLFTESTQKEFDKLTSSEKREFIKTLLDHFKVRENLAEGVFRRSPSTSAVSATLTKLVHQATSKQPLELDHSSETAIEVARIIKGIYGQNPIFTDERHSGESPKEGLRRLADRSLTDEEKRDAAKNLIKNLPEESRQALADLALGLDPIMENNDITKMGAANLAMTFAPQLTTPNDDPLEEAQEMSHTIQGLTFIFSHRHELFKAAS